MSWTVGQPTEGNRIVTTYKGVQVSRSWATSTSHVWVLVDGRVIVVPKQK